MKKFILLCVTLSFFRAEAITLDDKNMSEKIKSIVEQSGIKKNHLALFATSTSGEEIYSLNSKTKMIPASITKLFTAAAVLDTFKPDHQFKTQIFYDTKGNI